MLSRIKAFIMVKIKLYPDPDSSLKFRKIKLPKINQKHPKILKKMKKAPQPQTPNPTDRKNSRQNSTDRRHDMTTKH